jgi:superfamily II DNA or RNA helicase
MLTIQIKSNIQIIGTLPDQVEAYLRDRLTFPNPKYLENEKFNYWQGGTPEKLSYFHRTVDGYLLPRGFAAQLIKTFDYYHIPYKVVDLTRLLPPMDFSFQGDLRPYQCEAVKAILGRKFGVLEAPPGAGKTIMALGVIAERKQPALILTHTKELLYQWQERAVQFLGLEKEEIGLTGDGKKTIGHKLTVGIVNSVLKRTEEIGPRIGFVVVDECHRTPSRTFTEAVSGFDCRYMLGLSATPYRRDGLSRLIFFHLGDRVHSIETKSLQQSKQIMTATLVVRETGFDFDYYGPEDYQPLISSLAADPARNRMIAGDVLEASGGRNGISLVISDRKEHCKVLAGLVAKQRPTRELYGDISSAERKRIVAELNRGKIKVLVATSQLIGEGFDLPALSNLFLTTPIKFDGRVKQYAGRVLRTAKGKKPPTIFDYVDRPGVLQTSFKARKRAYAEMGIKC